MVTSIEGVHRPLRQQLSSVVEDPVLVFYQVLRTPQLDVFEVFSMSFVD